LKYHAPKLSGSDEFVPVVQVAGGATCPGALLEYSDDGYPAAQGLLVNFRDVSGRIFLVR
jgi:hypothetical protein